MNENELSYSANIPSDTSPCLEGLPRLGHFLHQQCWGACEVHWSNAQTAAWAHPHSWVGKQFRTSESRTTGRNATTVLCQTHQVGWQDEVHWASALPVPQTEMKWREGMPPALWIYSAQSLLVRKLRVAGSGRCFVQSWYGSLKNLEGLVGQWTLFLGKGTVSGQITLNVYPNSKFKHHTCVTAVIYNIDTSISWKGGEGIGNWERAEWCKVKRVGLSQIHVPASFTSLRMEVDHRIHSKPIKENGMGKCHISFPILWL